MPHIPAPFVSPEWLKTHLGDVVVCDVRWYLDGRSGRAAYLGGHLPGAVFVDLDAVLAATASPELGRHPLPEPDEFAERLGALGVADDAAVVAYDDTGGTTAGRLVWLLRALGQEAAVLDGGLGAWAGATEEGEGTLPARPRRQRPWPGERFATIDEVERLSSGEPGPPLVDARAADRYRGEAEPVDPRAGHVPGAHNLPVGATLGGDGRLLLPDHLRELLTGAGVRAGEDVIVYCGSGVSACHDLLVIEQAGLGPGRLWTGSWSQWSAREDLPAAHGPDSSAG